MEKKFKNENIIRKMIKEEIRKILNEVSHAGKIESGQWYVSSDGNGAELVVTEFWKSKPHKWIVVDFILKKDKYGHEPYMSSVGTSPENGIGDWGKWKLKKLNSQQKKIIQQILKDPDTIDLMKKETEININDIKKWV